MTKTVLISKDPGLWHFSRDIENKEIVRQ